jgi:hypothetical protein
MFRTAMPDSKYCSIMIKNADFANSFTQVSDCLHLPKTKKIMKIVSATNTCKRMNALLTTNDISHLQMPIISAPLCDISVSGIATRISKYITEVNYRGSQHEPQCNVVCHTDGSMLRDVERSIGSASAVFGANIPSNTFSASVAIPDGPPLSFRCELWGIIVAYCAVGNKLICSF